MHRMGRARRDQSPLTIERNRNDARQIHFAPDLPFGASYRRHLTGQSITGHCTFRVGATHAKPRLQKFAFGDNQARVEQPIGCARQVPATSLNQVARGMVRRRWS